MLAVALILSCVAPVVHDGDSLRCPGGRGMRLAAIDAPELAGSRRCRGCDDGAGRASRDHLRRVIAGRRVDCRIVDANPFRAGFQPADRYGRPVVRCTVAGIDLSDAQLAAGQAVRWPAAVRQKRRPPRK